MEITTGSYPLLRAKIKAHGQLSLLVISGFCLALSLTGWVQRRYGFDPAWGAILINGLPLLHYAIRGLFIRRDVTAGVLVSIALIAAVAIKEYFAAGEVAFIMALGEVLESMTVAKANSALHKLASLVPTTANVIRHGVVSTVETANLQIGDIVLVRPGESIPVDGFVLEGTSEVNQAAITGEAMPVVKETGSQVFIGTTNLLGALQVRATHVGENTTLAQVVELVRRAQADKAPIVGLADKAARLLVPIMLAVAVVVGVLTHDVVRAVTILVVFCPCALVLSVPTAMIAGIGNAAQRGIIIKGGSVCQQTANIDTVLFDKTGTLTQGKPEVCNISAFADISTKEILQVAHTIEQMSEHPLGQAIVVYALSLGSTALPAQEFQAVPGRGAQAIINGEIVGIGNIAYMQTLGCILQLEMENWQRQEEQLGRTTLFISRSKQIIGGISLADQLRANAKTAINALRKAGVSHIEMLTGDSISAAATMAGELGLTGFQANLLPGEKADAVKKLRAAGRSILMVGDGINDAPALAVADVGVAMGVTGTDIAVQTAGITLMTEDLGKLAEVICLSRQVKKVITQNIVASVVINIMAVYLASGGWLNPVLGALWHNIGSVAVVVNSARLLTHGPTHLHKKEGVPIIETPSKIRVE